MSSNRIITLPQIHPLLVFAIRNLHVSNNDPESRDGQLVIGESGSGRYYEQL
jgi:hypothetical protein